MGKILKIVGAVIGVVLLGAAAFVGYSVFAFNSSMAKEYEVPLVEFEASTDPEALARGKHLVIGMGGCALNDCHGADLGGGKRMEMGPLGVFQAPNITAGGIAKDYSDAELYRLLKHGIKPDNRSVVFMPSQDFTWWPDSDIKALISYIRTVPASDTAKPPSEYGVMLKVLDRQDMMKADIARRIDHTGADVAPAAAPTAAYGAYVARLCMGCHGDRLSGGPIPGAPPDLAVPLNLTPAEDGLKGWTFAEFDKLMRTGMRKNGKQLDPFMPIEGFKNFSEVEMKAMYEYLMTLEPKPFGER